MSFLVHCSLQDTFCFHCTCITSNRTGSPVAERGHDTVLLAGQLTWSHCVGARAVWTPRQQKQTQQGCGVTQLGTLYTFTKTQRRVVWNLKDQINWIILIFSSRFLLSGFLLTLAPHTTQYLRRNRIHWQVTGLGKKQLSLKITGGWTKTLFTPPTLFSLWIVWGPDKTWTQGLDFWSF